MIETIKCLYKEAIARRNGEKTNVVWSIGKGTSGGNFLWAVQNKVRCYIYISRNGKYSRPTFTLVTPKYPYGTDEVDYQTALQLAKY